MNELIWALIALALLGLVLLLGVGKDRNNLAGAGFIGLDDLIEGGLFAIAVMIVLLPLYPLYLLGVALWRWGHPIVPPPPLPVEGDDPVWGRNVNRRLAEEAYRAVQQALAMRDAELAKEYLGPSLYADLQAECGRLTAQRELNTRRDIQIDLVNVHDERIDDFKVSSGHILSYYFDVTLRGTMVNVTNDEVVNVTSDEVVNVTSDEGDVQFKAGSALPQPFEEELQFSSGPKAGRWWLVTLTGVPHVKKARAKSDHPRRKRGAAKAEQIIP